MSVYRTSHHSIPPVLRGCAITIGNFDGVHLGHQALVAELAQQARVRNIPAVVVTFDPPPAKLLRDDFRIAYLTTLEQRAELLHSYGASDVVIVETTKELLDMNAQEFFDEILRMKFDVHCIVEGANFRFGNRRSGDIGLLRDLCGPHGIDVSIVPDQFAGSHHVSSSFVRESILTGDLLAANRMLQRSYFVEGTVVNGFQRGRTIGFPTANLDGYKNLLPALGIYAGWCEVDGQKYATATHIGPNATFGETERVLESYLVGFDGDLYGCRLRIHFLEKLRDPIKFASVDSLVHQMKQDVTQTIKIWNRARTVSGNFLMPEVHRGE